jgi:hypothetical protein
VTYVYSKRPSGNTVRPHIEWIYRNFMFDVSVVQIQRRHTSTVDVNSHCRVRCRSSTKNKKHPVHTLSVQGIFTEKFPFLHTSNVSPKNGKSRQEDIRNVYRPSICPFCTILLKNHSWRGTVQDGTQKMDDTQKSYFFVCVLQKRTVRPSQKNVTSEGRKFGRSYSPYQVTVLYTEV